MAETHFFMIEIFIGIGSLVLGIGYNKKP